MTGREIRVDNLSISLSTRSKIKVYIDLVSAKLSIYSASGVLYYLYFSGAGCARLKVEGPVTWTTLFTAGSRRSLIRSTQ